ncbi:hypothetical protein AQ490_18130 [Wenjunlia vitaminophila]|uniref:DNA ligase (ATP) n=1 Tax=Wenjunlia vitaminophila TaxID=76728 RepID=A0A0T6LVC9_WENVI|nr:non-homologous end-joining DNA ligase [Wenjunlia vitaminophila]KRV49977.1 hypothetical protein AQ490_18130 [Wenjunlia vitaminophila]
MALGQPTPGELPVLAPMLATPATELPRDQTAWAFEVKWDGMRVVAYLPGDGRLRLVSRNRLQVAFRYPELEELSALLPGTDLILDGEIIAPDRAGRPSFGRLQERMHLNGPAAIRAGARRTPVALMLFDVLWASGELLTGHPYTARRHRLEDLGLEAERISVPPIWEGHGDEAARWTGEMGLEGVMAKRLTSVYRPGVRSRDWLKIKHQTTEELRIGGWIPAGPRATEVKSLLVGVDEGALLRYCGAVGSGFTQVERRRLGAVLSRLQTTEPPFVNARQALDRPEPVRWVRPVLTARVEFREWTDSGYLRQPVWRGLSGGNREVP